MALKSIASMTDKLLELTNAEQLQWGEEHGDVFLASMPSFNVTVWSGVDDDGIRFVSLLLSDHKGAEIDQVSAGEYDSEFDRLMHLFRAAKRSARNINDVLENFEAEVMSLGMK